MAVQLNYSIWKGVALRWPSFIFFILYCSWRSECYLKSIDWIEHFYFFAMVLVWWGVEGDGWRWRMMLLFAWEEKRYEECRSLLGNVVLLENLPDNWVWKHDPERGNSVKRVYQLLNLENHRNVCAPLSDFIWNKVAPLKVSFLFYLEIHLNMMIPTKDD